MQVKRVRTEVKEFSGLGERIKAARMADDRSLSEICRQSGVSRSYWYQLEKEQLIVPATEEMIRKVETVLNVDLGIAFDD